MARAVAASPAVRLIDEPFSGLDAETAASALRAVRAYLPRARLVYAVHEMPDDSEGVELRLPEAAPTQVAASGSST